MHRVGNRRDAVPFVYAPTGYDSISKVPLQERTVLYENVRAATDCVLDKLVPATVRRGMIPSAAQIRAGRGLLGWTRQELASRAQLSTKTVQQIEDGIVNPRASTLETLGRVMEEDGIQFLAPTKDGGEGVRRTIEALSHSP